MVHGLKTTLLSPSQLLRDLDSCNSDPVAVASCFVERVRTAGSWHHPALLGTSLRGKCWVNIKAFGVALGGAEWMACPRRMGIEMNLQMLGESVLWGLGSCL